MVASNAGIPRVWRMARSLKKEGLRVTILEWDRGVKPPESKNVDGIAVQRFSLRSSLGTKAAVWFPFWLVHAAAFALKNRFSILQVQNFDNLILQMALRRITGSKIVYDLADFYADAYLPKKGLLTEFIRCLERKMIADVDAVILVSEGQLEQTGVRNLPEVRRLIYNSLMDDEVLDYPTPSSARGAKQISLFYAGVLSRERLQPLLNLLAALRDVSDVTLKVAGFGETEPIVRERISELPNASYLGPLSRSDVMKHTANCDCVVVPYDGSVLNNRIGLPNKFFEALAEGKVVLVTKKSVAARIVEDAKCGYCADFGDPEDIERTLSLMSEKREEMAEMGERGLKLFNVKYRWSLMEERLTSLYECVVEK